MLRFLHGYIPESWKGLVRHGMIDNTSGVKFHQVYDTPEDARFNVLAKEGGELYEIVRECNRPFYLDRLQGGWSWLQYDFDFNLWKKYQEISGEWMLGMQMHEWASNMRNDWQRIMTGLRGEFVPDAEKITQAVMMPFHTPGVMRPNVESASTAEYAQMTPPQSAADCMAQYDMLFQRRQRQNMNLLLPCDSYYMNIRQEIAFGARALMPEVGGQIALMRTQLALTRGMARACGLKWGAYYEPWGGDATTCCYYKRDWVNEWGIIDAHTDCFVGGEVGFSPTSGSSRALQKRIYYYSLLSGAQFMSEEWGNSNTFYDWHDYELTPYGLIKRDFLRFCADHRDLGDPVIPAALVLPPDFEVFDLFYLTGREEYLGYPIEDAARAERFARMRRVLHNLLGDGKKRIGNEGHTICNSRYGDLFDIVYADVPAAALDKYDLLIDLDGTLAQRYPQLAERVLSAQDENALYAVLDQRLARLSPVQVSGSLSWIVNRTADGWVLGLFNNEGVRRSRAEGEVRLHEADTVARIATPHLPAAVLLGDERALRRGDDGVWTFDLPAGECAIIKLNRVE